MADLLYKEEVFRIIGAAIEVHKELGPGFSEPVYQQSLEIELGLQKIPFEAQKVLRLYYKSIKLKKRYIPDFFCYDKIIIEIKALTELVGRHEAQLLNYLKASGVKIGLLINFGSYGKLKWKRFIY